jgi:uncharacterized delta-60 repeat protein
VPDMLNLGLSVAFALQRVLWWFRCGRVLLAAVAVAISASGTRAQTPGDFDVGGFGSTSTTLTGKITFSVASGTDSATAVAVQPDGKIVVAGSCFDSVRFRNDFCIARRNADGSPDVGFNGQGSFRWPVTDVGNDDLRAIALQPDRKIIVAGRCTSPITGNFDFCVLRFNENGTMDEEGFPGLPHTGHLLPIGSSDDELTSVALQPDGKIVLAGFCLNSSARREFCAARYNSDGSLDTSFDGPDAANPGNGRFMFSIGSGNDTATAIAVGADGKIVIAGTCVDEASSAEFCVARLNADGKWDPSFLARRGPQAGRFSFLVGNGNSFASAVAIQPDGKVVIAGTCMDGTARDFCVARLRMDGELDTGRFGVGAINGVVMTMGPGNDTAHALALQRDGKIIVAGGCVDGIFAYFCVARLNTDGTWDSSFDGPTDGGNGRVSLRINVTYDTARAMALQPDGKIVIGGQCNNTVGGLTSVDFCIARLHGGPFDAQQCDLDIDGDGIVLPTTDVIILNRIARGVTGGAALQYVGLPPRATRTTWLRIREYLNAHCGMQLPLGPV